MDYLYNFFGYFYTQRAPQQQLGVTSEMKDEIKNFNMSKLKKAEPVIKVVEPVIDLKSILREKFKNV